MKPDEPENDHMEGARLDFSEAMSYGDYLDLDKLLSCQNPLSDSHDEMLFIVIHQATELWLKLAVHELSATLPLIRKGNLRPVFKILSRVARIQSQLFQSWEVLSTMTPADYLAFRDVLGASSGFQSHQYRMMEFLLGNRNARLTEPFRHRPEILAKLRDILDSPSLYDEVVILLSRRGLPIDEARLHRDWHKPCQADNSVADAWLTVYRNTEKYWDLYELGEKLVDLEEAFRRWRFRHLTTVERTIGMRRGTGGTAGVGYLVKALEIRLFPELWDIRTRL